MDGQPLTALYPPIPEEPDACSYQWYPLWGHQGKGPHGEYRPPAQGKPVEPVEGALNSCWEYEETHGLRTERGWAENG